MLLHGGKKCQAPNLRPGLLAARAKSSTLARQKHIRSRVRKISLALRMMMGQFARVLGGTAALHSHSTVGGCIFFTPFV
jgi:hypothetical protein